MKKICASKLPRPFVLRCLFDSAKIHNFNFPPFSKINNKRYNHGNSRLCVYYFHDITDTFDNKLLELCVLILVLNVVQPTIKFPHFTLGKSCDLLKLDTSADKKKKRKEKKRKEKKEKKRKQKQKNEKKERKTKQSKTMKKKRKKICHKLWDTTSFFLSFLFFFSFF